MPPNRAKSAFRGATALVSPALGGILYAEFRRPRGPWCPGGTTIAAPHQLANLEEIVTSAGNKSLGAGI